MRRGEDWPTARVKWRLEKQRQRFWWLGYEQKPRGYNSKPTDFHRRLQESSPLPILENFIQSIVGVCCRFKSVHSEEVIFDLPPGFVSRFDWCWMFMDAWFWLFLHFPFCLFIECCLFPLFMFWFFIWNLQSFSGLLVWGTIGCCNLFLLFLFRNHSPSFHHPNMLRASLSSFTLWCWLTFSVFWTKQCFGA